MNVRSAWDKMYVCISEPGIEWMVGLEQDQSMNLLQELLQLQFQSKIKRGVIQKNWRDNYSKEELERYQFKGKTGEITVQRIN